MPCSVSTGFDHTRGSPDRPSPSKISPGIYQILLISDKMESTSYRQTVEQHGFSLVPGVLDKHQVADLISEVRSALGRRPTKQYAMRRLLELVRGVRQLCEETAISTLLEPIIGDRAFPVRGIFFDKNPEANWGVSWHQDLTIAVIQRIDTEGFGPWSIKEGVDHVQPPVSILERMLTLGIHLDDADADNGALRLIPGSHNRGIIPRETIANLKKHLRSLLLLSLAECW